MAKNKKNKLPQTLYVRWNYPGGNEEPWLTANESAEDSVESASDEKVVGVYELKKEVLVKSTVSVSVQEKR
jgi:hypothetical protein